MSPPETEAPGEAVVAAEAPAAVLESLKHLGEGLSGLALVADPSGAGVAIR